MLIDYFLCRLQEIITLIADTPIQIIMCQKLKINDFNILIDGKSFFDLPVKNKEEADEKIIEISNKNDYATGNLLNFAFFKEN